MALTDRHPDAERLAEYADGMLTADTCADVHRHLAVCAECRAVLVETMAFTVADQPERASPLEAVRTFRQRHILTGVGLLLAASVVLLVRWERQGTRASDRAAFLAALSAQPARTVTGRITADRVYKPAPASTRDQTDSPAPADIRMASSRLQAWLRSSAAPEERALVGLSMLAEGRRREALDNLIQASRELPGNAGIHSDLAAAQIEECKRRLPLLCANAVESADRALSIDDTFVPALFNRAVALELKGDRPAAIEAWKQYLARSVEPGWSDEARRRLLALTDGRDSR